MQNIKGVIDVLNWKFILRVIDINIFRNGMKEAYQLNDLLKKCDNFERYHYLRTPRVSSFIHEENTERRNTYRLQEQRVRILQTMQYLRKIKDGRYMLTEQGEYVLLTGGIQAKVRKELYTSGFVIVLSGIALVLSALAYFRAA